MTGQTLRARHPVASMIARRLAAGLITVVAVAALVFFAVSLLPGDVVAKVLGRGASPAKAEELRRQLGLDQPVVRRFSDWLSNALHGDLGRSLTGPDTVAELIGPRLRNTLVLAGVSALLLVPLGLGLGALAGAKAGRATDTAVSNVLLVLLSVHEFVVGTLLAYAFGIRLRWFPPVALFDSAAGPWSKPSALVLPVLTLVLVNVGYTARMIRASVAESMRSDYVRMARLNGVEERTVVTRYALRNSLAPGVQMIGLTLLYMIGGTVVVEVVFQYPGIGLLATTAATNYDYTTLTGIAVCLAVLFVLVNLATDLTVVALTPRLRTEW